MTESKYERIVQNDTDVHTQNESIELDYNTRVEIPKSTIRATNVIQTAIVTVILILIYFVLSIGLTFYQRWLLEGFHFPLSVVLYHLVVKLILSALIRLLYKCFTGRSRILLDWRTFYRNMAPTGLASGIDIGFSNWGLELVKISLYTMTKSTTIVFILIFAILLGLEKKSWSLLMIVVMISGGLCMFTFKSTQFNALGFSFLLFASLSSGIRWSFAQLVMQKSKIGLHNPVDMVFHMQPWMILAILPFALCFEGPRLLDGYQLLGGVDSSVIYSMWIKISVGAFIAFAMELSEFLVLSKTSSLTLSVAGIFKEICQLVLAVELNGDQLSVMNILGLIMCLMGICSHVIHKFSIYSKSRTESSVTFDTNIEQANIQSHTGQRMPLLDDLGNSESDDSQNENQNSSEVIFDVLKRRDTRR